jgi:hypothetical protein
MLQPIRAFPSWFLRVECERCGKVTMLNEAHATDRRRTMPINVLLSRMRHDGCGGRPSRAELLTGIDGVSSRPVPGTGRTPSPRSGAVRVGGIDLGRQRAYRELHHVEADRHHDLPLQALAPEVDRGSDLAALLDQQFCRRAGTIAHGGLGQPRLWHLDCKQSFRGQPWTRSAV